MEEPILNSHNKLEYEPAHALEHMSRIQVRSGHSRSSAIPTQMVYGA